ncbi:MAG: hypothetical protein OEM30_09165 [Gammaproteobacteria bacterium]|nr:hypothetical protein [Gammaproteobacteria bacterium]
MSAFASGWTSGVLPANNLQTWGEMDIASLGVNWWLTPIFSLNADYRYVWNERLGVEGTSSGLNTRLVIMLE